MITTSGGTRYNIRFISHLLRIILLVESQEEKKHRCIRRLVLLQRRYVQLLLLLYVVIIYLFFYEEHHLSPVSGPALVLDNKVRAAGCAPAPFFGNIREAHLKNDIRTIFGRRRKKCAGCFFSLVGESKFFWTSFLGVGRGARQKDTTMITGEHNNNRKGYHV